MDEGDIGAVMTFGGCHLLPSVFLLHARILEEGLDLYIDLLWVVTGVVSNLRNGLTEALMVVERRGS